MGKDGDLGIARVVGSSGQLFGEASFVVYILRIDNWIDVTGFESVLLMVCRKRFISVCLRTGHRGGVQTSTRIDSARFTFRL